ncbi:hypothetical protein [Paractinoplanes durhamensis]
MVANNLLPLIQVGRAVGLHPFGRGTRAAALLSLACFGALPLFHTPGLIASVPAFLIGVWLLRGHLALEAFKPMRRTR